MYQEKQISWRLVTRLLQSQTEGMAAQAKAVTVQLYPPYPALLEKENKCRTTGAWVEKLQEKAVFAGWTPSDQLYQLKLHLDKTALDIFRMLPDVEKSCATSVIAALKKRFRSTDIE